MISGVRSAELPSEPQRVQLPKSSLSFPEARKVGMGESSVFSRLEVSDAKRAAPSTLSVARELGEQARADAKQDKSDGLGVLEGLEKQKKRNQLRNFLAIANQVIEYTEKRGASGAADFGLPDIHPLEVISHQLGTAGQSYLTSQALQSIESDLLPELGLDSLAETLGLDLSSSSDEAAATLGGTASSIVGAAGAIYSAYQLFDNWGENTLQGGMVQGASLGAYAGSMIAPGIGTAIGGVLGGIVGAASSLFGSSSKHKDQVARDAMRDFLQSKDVIDDKHQLTLQDGTKYDIGRDGRYKYANVDGTERSPYQTDPSNPLTHQAIGWAQPMGMILMGGNKKLSSDFTGYLVNAATSNAQSLEEVRANLLTIWNKSGLNPASAFPMLQSLYANGALSEDQLVAYANGIKTLTA